VGQTEGAHTQVGPTHGGQTELADLDDCIRRLDPQADIGYDRIAARCPDLAHQLEQSGWGKWLPRGWRQAGNDLSAASLRELRELAARELATRLSARTPEVAFLKSVLAELAGNSSGNVTWWTRFKEWLHSIFESREQDRDEGWLDRLISRVGFSQSMLDLISYAALAAVVALAGVIVLNELRAAGVLEKRRPPKRNQPGQHDSQARETGWETVQRAEPGERPRLLLELIATRLAGPPFVPPSRALTVRELARTAIVTEPDDRARLVQLAAAAERVRFSAHEVPAATLERPLIRGRELLDRLSGRTRS
jgi:hypothetical protein